MMARFTTFITPKKINILDLFDCKGLSSSSAPRAIRDWLIPASRCPTMCLTSSAPSPRTRLAVRETWCIRSDDQISSLPTIRHALQKETYHFMFIPEFKSVYTNMSKYYKLREHNWKGWLPQLLSFTVKASLLVVQFVNLISVT